MIHRRTLSFNIGSIGIEIAIGRHDAVDRWQFCNGEGHECEKCGRVFLYGGCMVSNLFRPEFYCEECCPRCYSWKGDQKHE